MKASCVRRGTSLLVLLALLVAQAWGGPADRLIRACCCKPTAIAQTSISAAPCCAPVDRPQRMARLDSRCHAAPDGLALIASAPTGALAAPRSTAPAALAARHIPEAGVGRGPPYQLRI